MVDQEDQDRRGFEAGRRLRVNGSGRVSCATVVCTGNTAGAFEWKVC